MNNDKCEAKQIRTPQPGDKTTKSDGIEVYKIMSAMEKIERQSLVCLSQYKM